jgi:hypothetical protein
VKLARSFWVPTPDVSIEKVLVKLPSGGSYETLALCRDWIDGTVFDSMVDLCQKVKLFLRRDFLYFFLVDLLLACWDRNCGNILYAEKDDCLVPIDYGRSFSFDKIPMTSAGIKAFLSPFILLGHYTGYYEMHPMFLGEVYQKFLERIDLNILYNTNPELVSRAEMMTKALGDYLMTNTFSSIGNYDLFRRVEDLSSLH